MLEEGCCCNDASPPDSAGCKFELHRRGRQTNGTYCEVSVSRGLTSAGTRPGYLSTSKKSANERTTLGDRPTDAGAGRTCAGHCTVVARSDVTLGRSNPMSLCLKRICSDGGVTRDVHLSWTLVSAADGSSRLHMMSHGVRSTSLRKVTRDIQDTVGKNHFGTTMQSMDVSLAHHVQVCDSLNFLCAQPDKFDRMMRTTQERHCEIGRTNTYMWAPQTSTTGQVSLSCSAPLNTHVGAVSTLL